MGEVRPERKAANKGDLIEHGGGGVTGARLCWGTPRAQCYHTPQSYPSSEVLQWRGEAAGYLSTKSHPSLDGDTAVKGLALPYFGFALRVGLDAPQARKIPAGAGGALQVFAVKSLQHRGGYQGTWQKTNTVCYTLY